MKLSRTYKRIIQIELNEISYPIIEQLIAKGKLPNFAKLNKEWSYLKTSSEQEYDKLEPWIQWVTAHTGKTFEEHQIFRLSDAHQLKQKQIWEELSENKVESGIIGSMNATRNNTEGGIFFPDPWAKHNDSYPDNLKPLWDLISRRVNAHATSSSLSIGDMMKGLKTCMDFRLPLGLYFKMARQIIGQKANPKTKWKLAAVFDLFLAEILKSVLKRTDFGYYTLFLNSIAHYQHHYWRNFDRSPFDKSINYPDIAQEHDPIAFGYEMYDKILGEILKLIGKDEDTLVIVASGLSQVPYTEKEAEGGMNYYRLNDHTAFAEKLGLTGDDFSIFPLMSRDWQIKYNSDAARQKALYVLNDLTINGEQLFNLKENTEGYVFVETKYTRGIEDGDQIKDANGKGIANFNEIFTNIAIKSGHHVGIGNLWFSDTALQDYFFGKKIPLTQLYTLTLEALGKKKAQTV